MGTANIISGFTSLNTNLPQHLSNTATDTTNIRAGDDVHNPELILAGSRNQTVEAATNPEISNFSKDGDQPERQKVVDAVKNINDFFQMVQRTLQFSVDEDTGRAVVKITDVMTQEVIRQIPSIEMLQIAKQLDKLKGLLFDDKA